jgi:hypothetical protein
MPPDAAGADVWVEVGQLISNNDVCVNNDALLFVIGESITVDETSESREENEAFDLAFGIDRYLPGFAATFTERPARWFHYWPDDMITDADGRIMPISLDSVFKSNFDYMMRQYFILVPDGRFKFNLGGMDSSRPGSLTTWGLAKISTTPAYATRTDYYEYLGASRRQLTPAEADQSISDILRP